MADPLSIGAGVVGIIVPALHGVHLLIEDVNKIIDAPEAIQGLEQDLKSTALALESLKSVPESQWQSLGTAVANQSKDAIETCGSACNGFHRDLGRWTKRSRDGKLSWRDRAVVGLFKERQMDAMSQHLQSCKVTCSSVAGMGTLWISLQTSQTTKDLQQAIANQRDELSRLAAENSHELKAIQQRLDQLNLSRNDAVDDEDEDAEEDRDCAEAQLEQQRAAVEQCQALFEQLQTMLKEERIAEVTGGKGNVAGNVTLGNITGGIGVGVSNAPINATFGGLPPER